MSNDNATPMMDSAPDLGNAPLAGPDVSILAGSNPGPAAPTGGTNDAGVPSLGADSNYQQAPQPTGDGSSASPFVVPTFGGANGMGVKSGVPSFQGNTDGTPPNLMGKIMQSVLWSLAGSSGSKNFGSGLSGGAAGVIAGQQQQVKNAQVQQQLNFESLRAADASVLARKQAEEADLSIQEHKEILSDNAAQREAYYERNHIKPSVQLSANNSPDMHAQGSAALSTVADANGGRIPFVTTTNSAVGAGADPSNHQINVYAATPQTVAGIAIDPRTKSVPKIVNDRQAALNLPLYTDDTWGQVGLTPELSAPTRGLDAKTAIQNFQKKTIEDSMAFSAPPDIQGGKNSQEITGNNAPVVARAEQQLANYKNSNNPDSQFVALLQSRIDTLRSRIKNAGNDADKAQAASITAETSAKAAQAQAIKLADANTPQGRADLAQKQQETINARYKNAEDHQKALFNEGVDPVTGERLNVSNAPDEALIDGNTGKPIPTKMLTTLKPTEQESNRADFARSTLHTLDLLDDLKAKGKLPNGPLTGLTAKGLQAAGLSSQEAAEAISYIALAQSSATGAHVGGRFNKDIMAKMGTLLNLNSGDDQFAGQETALRNVMTPYAQQGGRQTVAQYKQDTIGTVKTLKNGQKVRITGFDKNGNFIGEKAE